MNSFDMFYFTQYFVDNFPFVFFSHENEFDFLKLVITQKFKKNLIFPVKYFFKCLSFCLVNNDNERLIKNK